jgi:hypothetical protein
MTLNLLNKRHIELAVLVKRECQNLGSAGIEIIQKAGNGRYFFYEIKTLNSLRPSIITGFGQLLEYCLYLNVVKAEKVVLASNVPPSKERVTYFYHIKNFLNMPFSYIHFYIDKEEIISEI